VLQRPAKREPTKMLLIVLLLLAATEFVIRGPLRYFPVLSSGSTWSDITQIYVPSRAWLMGEDPYDPDNFMVLYHQATNAVVDRGGFRSHSPHPLTALVVFSPIASLPWPWARVLWTLLISTIIFPAIWALSSLLGVGRSNSKLAFAAGTLALAPLHTGIAVGNVSILGIALCTIAFWASTRQKDILAGTLIALSACLKPQLGALFLLYYLLRRRWRIVWVAVAVGSAVFVVGVLRLGIAGTPWWKDFWENAGLTEHHRLMDFADPSSLRFTMINLQVVLYGLLPNSFFANAGALLVGLSLWGRWAYIALRAAAGRSELLMASTFLTIGLLPSYHRNYDAVLLIFPLCWALSAEAANYGRSRTLALLSIAPFLLPGPMLLQSLVDKGVVAQSVASGWSWNKILMPHQTWLLLILSIVLLQAFCAEPRPNFGLEDKADAVPFPAPGPVPA